MRDWKHASRASKSKQLPQGIGDAGGGGAVGGPEVGVIGDGGVAGVEALGGGVEEVETFGGDAGDDFSGDAAVGEGFADHQQPSGAGDAG